MSGDKVTSQEAGKTELFGRSSVMVRTSFNLLMACVLAGGLFAQAADDDPRKSPEEPDRSERFVVENSRVLLLIDTSRSMGLVDGERSPSGVARSRIQQVVDALDGSDFLTRLRRTHEIAVYRFDDTLRQVVVLPKLPAKTEADDEPGDAKAVPGSGGPKPAKEPLRWRELLIPGGAETRLGESLRKLIEAEQDSMVSGIILCSDGCQNAGGPVEAAVASAREAEIPIITIAIGSARGPTNVAVLDLLGPTRVYPGRFVIVGHLRAVGMTEQTVSVELLARQTGSNARWELLDSMQIALGADGKVVPVRFEVMPDKSGRHTYKVAVKAPASDDNPLDDFKTVDVVVVERRTSVLLMAGGPSREFRFLRNLLYRDRETTLDVWLQTGKPGISQESDNLLFEFPESVEELSKYDCIMAFDPDWNKLDSHCIQNLEDWVAEQAGGLVIVAGPVHTPRLGGMRQGDPGLDTIRSLLPVVLDGGGAARRGLGRFGGKEAWPLEFTREGLEAEFLWLDDNQANSEAAWTSFEGVCGHFAITNAKPGTRVYARFSDPNTAVDGVLPIYLAGHFYGAGRVFFQASGEMWRMRAVDETYFMRYYTKLLRWISQGRLLRDSARGVLLVDKDRCLLGDTVKVRAILKDAQYEPLAGPEVIASLVHPRGERTALKLRAVKEAAREGTFTGQFAATEQGDYRLELRPPHAGLDKSLVRQVRVRLPPFEIESARRNDPLLVWIAQESGGGYHVGLDAATSPEAERRMDELLKDKTRILILPAVPGSKRE